MKEIFTLTTEEQNRIFNGLIILSVAFTIAWPVQNMFGDVGDLINPVRFWIMVNVLFMVHEREELGKAPNMKSIIRGLAYAPTWIVYRFWASKK